MSGPAYQTRDDLAERLARAEVQIAELRERLTNYEDDRKLLNALNDTVASVKDDTEAIIALFKGGTMVGKIFLWMVLVASGVVGIITFFIRR